MQLLVVESPAKAKTINKYLGKDFKVVASYGHIRDLPSKNGSVDPDNDFLMHYEVPPKSIKHIRTIADLMKNAETIYLATDPDREGESISWHIIEELKQRKKLKKTTSVKRVVFHEITKNAVLKAINHPRDIDMNLVNAQQARRALDYLVGFTLSPVLWRKLPGSRSAGRVQSVALRLICERENEIEVFSSREYWNLLLHLVTDKNETFAAKITHIDGQKLEQFSITNAIDAENIATILQTKTYSILDVEKKQAKRNPQAPFTTSSLQQEASRKLGYSTKRTMSIAQKLYEGVDIGGNTVGLITYMRTDSVNISDDAIKQSRDIIIKNYGQEYLPPEARKYQSKTKNAQEAHEAIRPTDLNITPQQLANKIDDEQYQLYKLIWERLVASQMQSAVLNQVGVNIQSNDAKYIARATGSTIEFDGFYKVYQEQSDDDNPDKEGEKILPPLNQGQKITLNKVEPTQHFTQPPPRYSEASLVKKLEELGIGRPSTYASIISVLQDRNYVKLEKRRFIAEERGRIVTAFLESFFKRYVEYDFTANLEEELDDISNGKIDWKQVLRNFWVDFNQNILETKKYKISQVIEQLNDLLAPHLFPRNDKGEIDRTCPLCHKGQISIKLTKYGAFLGCTSYPDCNYTKQLSQDGESGSDKKEPRLLGQDEDCVDVTVRQGPFGWYIQVGEAEGKKKPKRVGIPKNMNHETITIEEALGLLSLPRFVGQHPETKMPIHASIGKFGPYLQHNGKYVSLKEDNVLDIGINRAVTLIDQAPVKGAKSSPIHVIGNHPDSGKEIAVYSGRYGAYIKYDKSNIKIPKGKNYKELSLEEVLELIAKKS